MTSPDHKEGFFVQFNDYEPQHEMLELWVGWSIGINGTDYKLDAVMPGIHGFDELFVTEWLEDDIEASGPKSIIHILDVESIHIH